MPSVNPSDFEKLLGMRGIKPGAAGREARTLPLCYAAPHLLSFFDPFLLANMNHPVCHEHFNQAFIILNHTSPLPFGCQGLFNSLSSYLSPSLSLTHTQVPTQIFLISKTHSSLSQKLSPPHPNALSLFLSFSLYHTHQCRPPSFYNA